MRFPKIECIFANLLNIFNYPLDISFVSSGFQINCLSVNTDIEIKKIESSAKAYVDLSCNQQDCTPPIFTNVFYYTFDGEKINTTLKFTTWRYFRIQGIIHLILNIFERFWWMYFHLFFVFNKKKYLTTNYSNIFVKHRSNIFSIFKTKKNSCWMFKYCILKSLLKDRILCLFILIPF